MTEEKDKSEDKKKPTIEQKKRIFWLKRLGNGPTSLREEDHK
jgi:hypothetical protein